MARIGVNALYLIPGGVGGTEIYLRNLLRALAKVDTENEYFVFTNAETSDLVPTAPNFRKAPHGVWARLRPARLLWEQTVLPVEARRLRLDVLLNPGFTAPALCGCPTVTVFHDLQHKRHPEHFRWFDLPFWRAFLYSAAHSSDRLIAVSEATRADLARYYPRTASKVFVVPHGVSDAFLEIARQRAQHPPGRFLLCVSTLHPHKNLVRLVRAFLRVHASHPDFRLVIAGMYGFHTRTIEQTIAENKAQPYVQLTGWIPREELLDLYRTAWAFVYPSTFEGFGMPVLEAMAAAVPAAVSDIEPLRSLAGAAALRFDPASETDIAAALCRLVEDDSLRRRLMLDAPRRAAGFTWEATARGTLDVLRAAMGTTTLRTSPAATEPH